MVDRLLAEAQIRLADLDAIAFGRGPGSFTGVRIATGVAQGLAFSSDVPVIGISTLATLAQAARDKAEYIVAAIDARMEEVYFGLYQSGTIVTLIGAESVTTPENILLDNAGPCYGLGSGFLRYGHILQKKFAGILTGYAGDCYPHAQDMIALALAACARGEAVKPEDAMPVYLRNKVTDVR